MRTDSVGFVVLLLLAGALGACKSSGARGAPAVKVNPANVQAQAAKPPPPDRHVQGVDRQGEGGHEDVECIDR